MGDYQQLEVWQLSHQLVLDVYRVTKKFPKEEEYTLKSQLLRSVISVPNNIAEGKGRQSPNELRQFLYISRGSLQETEYLLFLSTDLGYIKTEDFNRLKESIDSIGKMLNRFIQTIQ
ncbi:MAG: four helix bundle protein [Bacteroidetes bacterium]|nr:four helix bundle protein [Bacteroidota bacterium]